MNIVLDNRYRPKLKNSEMLSIVGMLTEVAYQIGMGMGYDMTIMPVQVLYASSLVSKTGSSILEKLEQQEKTFVKDVEDDSKFTA